MSYYYDRDYEDRVERDYRDAQDEKVLWEY